MFVTTAWPFCVWTTCRLANAGVVSEIATMALRISNFAFISVIELDGQRMEIFQFFRKLRKYLRVCWLSVSSGDELTLSCLEPIALEHGRTNCCEPGVGAQP